MKKKTILFIFGLIFVFVAVPVVYAESYLNPVNESNSVIEDVNETDIVNESSSVIEEIYTESISFEFALEYLSQTSEQVWFKIEQLRAEGENDKANAILQGWRTCKKETLNYLVNIPTNQNTNIYYSNLPNENSGAFKIVNITKIFRQDYIDIQD